MSKKSTNGRRAHIECRFPALVHAGRGGKRLYEIRPLLRLEPKVRARRFDQAMREFKAMARRYLRMEIATLSRENLEDALWFQFNPEVKLETIEIQEPLGDGLVKGEFSAAWFDLKGQRFVVLPGFENHIFLADNSSSGELARVFLRHQIQETILRLIRRKRRENTAREDGWRVEHSMRGRGEFLTVVDFEARIDHARLIDQKGAIDLAFFFMSGDRGELDGETELENVGNDLNIGYPDRLQRAVRREGLVERVYRALYGYSSTDHEKQTRESLRERRRMLRAARESGQDSARDAKTGLPAGPRNRATVLVGPRGAGKTTLIHEAIYRRMHAARELTPTRRRRIERVFRVDPNRVIAGMAVIGQWQRRFEAILRFLIPHPRKRRRDILLIDNLPALARVGKSSQNNMTLADVLKPFLENRELGVIAEATPEQWKVFQELHRPLADLFEVIRVPEPGLTDALRMVLHERARLESRFECEITGEALGELIDLRARFLARRALPGSMIDLLRPVAGKHGGGRIDRGEIRQALLERERMATGIIENDDALGDEELIEFLRERLVGQNAATRELADALHRSRAGLADPEKPRAVFLFIGPTGVGKTEAARALAAYLHKDEEQLVRFDMNEYVDGGAAGRLIGDMGRPGGQLTERIRYQPQAVLLLDEIEKAHPLVHDLLLQVLGEGRLTDAVGRTTDFTGTMIVMTSNLGAQEAGRVTGFDQTAESLERVYAKATREFFRPEFLNRIDAVVPFARLEEGDMIHIARLQIARLLARDGYQRRNMLLNIGEDVLRQVARAGFDARQGGRALKRRIEKDLTALSADELAALAPGSPMLFEIELKGERLQPSVLPLREVPVRSGQVVRGLQTHGAVVARLRGLVQELEEQLRDFETAGASGGKGGAGSGGEAKSGGEANEWIFFALKDRIFSLREEVRLLLNNTRHLFEQGLARVLEKERHGEIIAAPRLVREEALLELSELYTRPGFRASLAKTLRQADPLAEREAGLLLEALQIDTRLLGIMLHGFQKRGEERLLIRLRPLGFREDKIELTGLARIYERAFAALDLPAEIIHEANEILVTASGPGLARLFAGETGLHMFFDPGGVTRPVLVDALVAPNEFKATDGKELLALWKRDPAAFATDAIAGTAHSVPRAIIRLYALPREPGEDDAILDLARGLISRGRPGKLALKIWLDPGREESETP